MWATTGWNVNRVKGFLLRFSVWSQENVTENFPHSSIQDFNIKSNRTVSRQRSIDSAKKNPSKRKHLLSNVCSEGWQLWGYLCTGKVLAFFLPNVDHCSIIWRRPGSWSPSIVISLTAVKQKKQGMNSALEIGLAEIKYVCTYNASGIKFLIDHN